MKELLKAMEDEPANPVLPAKRRSMVHTQVENHADATRKPSITSRRSFLIGLTGVVTSSLARFKVLEKLPKNAVGKVVKQELKGAV